MKTSSFFASIIDLFQSNNQISSSESKSEDSVATVLTEKMGKTMSTDPILEMYSHLVLPESGLLFRGIDFDMSKTEVQKIELNRPECSEMDGIFESDLTVKTSLGSEALNFAEIRYGFEEQNLNAIEIKIYNGNKEQASNLLDMVKNYYAKNVGEATTNIYGGIVFKGSNERYKYEIELVDVTEKENVSNDMQLSFYKD